MNIPAVCRWKRESLSFFVLQVRGPSLPWSAWSELWPGNKDWVWAAGGGVQVGRESSGVHVKVWYTMFPVVLLDWIWGTGISHFPVLWKCSRRNEGMWPDSIHSGSYPTHWTRCWFLFLLNIFWTINTSSSSLSSPNSTILFALVRFILIFFLISFGMNSSTGLWSSLQIIGLTIVIYRMDSSEPTCE